MIPGWGQPTVGQWMQLMPGLRQVFFEKYLAKTPRWGPGRCPLDLGPQKLYCVGFGWAEL